MASTIPRWEQEHLKEVLTGQAEPSVAVVRRVSCVCRGRMNCIANLPLFCDNLELIVVWVFFSLFSGRSK